MASSSPSGNRHAGRKARLTSSLQEGENISTETNQELTDNVIGQGQRPIRLALELEGVAAIALTRLQFLLVDFTSR